MPVKTTRAEQFLERDNTVSAVIPPEVFFLLCVLHQEPSLLYYISNKILIHSLMGQEMHKKSM